jgi:hypothetical protein
VTRRFNSWGSLFPGNQFVLDPRSTTPEQGSLEQVSAFLIDQTRDAILWLEIGNFFLCTFFDFADNFNHKITFQIDVETENPSNISFSSRNAADNGNDTWPVLASLMSMGTTSEYVGLYQFEIGRKLLTGEGLRGFLQRSANLKTLDFILVYFDTECCRLLGETSHSPFSFFRNCQLETPNALGDGMRLNGGPTLLITGTGYLDGSMSLGLLETNTKLESLVIKNFPYFDAERMDSFLLALSARGLCRLEFNKSYHRQLGFAPCAWAKLWRCLSHQPSINTISFILTLVCSP